MDNTYDLSRLDREEKFELRRIQRKMKDVNAPKVRTRRSEHEPEDPELDRLTLEEMIQYAEILRKLEGLPSAYAHSTNDPDGWLDGEHHTLPTPRHPKPEYCNWCGHLLRTSLGDVAFTNSSGVYCSEQCLENSQQRRRSGVTAAAESEKRRDISLLPAQPAEPVAVAPAPAPAPVNPTTKADKPHKLPADNVATALHQLDGILRFGA